MMEMSTKALLYRMKAHRRYRLLHLRQIEIHDMWLSKKSKTRISGGLVSGQLTPGLVT